MGDDYDNPELNKYYHLNSYDRKTSTIKIIENPEYKNGNKKPKWSAYEKRDGYESTMETDLLDRPVEYDTKSVSVDNSLYWENDDIADYNFTIPLTNEEKKIYSHKKLSYVNKHLEISYYIGPRLVKTNKIIVSFDKLFQYVVNNSKDKGLYKLYEPIYLDDDTLIIFSQIWYQKFKNYNSNEQRHITIKVSNKKFDIYEMWRDVNILNFIGLYMHVIDLKKNIEKSHVPFKYPRWESIPQIKLQLPIYTSQRIIDEIKSLNINIPALLINIIDEYVHKYKKKINLLEMEYDPSDD